MTIDLQKTMTICSSIASIILAFLWLDARHDAAGAAEDAERKANQFTLALAIADLSSTISRYDGMEAAGALLEGNRLRRDALKEQRQVYITRSLALENLTPE